MKSHLAAVLVAAGLVAGTAAAQTQGISKTEIVLGSIQDLSGPLATYSKPLVNGLRMRIDEINDEGGINGRKLKLIVEDSGYDPKKGVLAAQKLVQSDKVFAVIGTIGTPINLATMPIQAEKNVINFLPLTAARQMYDPPTPLKWSFAAPYYDQVRAGTKYMVKTKGYKRVCVLYQDDDFGQEILQGTEQGLKEIGMQLAERTSYKRGATDFSSQVQRLRNASCDFVVLGTVIRETIGSVGEARKIGWNVDFMGSTASYDALIPKLGGKMMDGFYTMSASNIPYPDDPSKNVRDWLQRYKTKFGEDATLFSAYGWTVMSHFQRVTQNAGPNLSTDSWIAAMEKHATPRDMFGADEMSWSKTKHLGTSRSRLSQIQGGRWMVVTDYLTE
jgi:branched-chain amino acid transport system substrate-binding protein